MKKHDFSNTRCFIDFDSTIADSLPKYNMILDDLLKGKITDEDYISYYQDFGDAYDIIPGSPWKSILRDLIEYHANMACPLPFDEKVRDEIYMIFLAYVVEGEKPGEPPARRGSDKECELVERLTMMFEDGCRELFPTFSYEQLAIDPVIEFCRRYKDMGGHLVIHSGTNKAILKAMLDTLGIEDLFEDYLCSNMMEGADPAKLGKWGYKTELLNRLLDKYPVNGMKDAVMGDTKGDAFGAYEVGLPFLLVWRGYPKNPSRLSGEDGYLTPTATVSMVQEDLEAKPGEAFECEIEKMLDFMDAVSKGEAQAPAYSTDVETA